LVVLTLSKLSEECELYPVGLEPETFSIRVQDLNLTSPLRLGQNGWAKTPKPKYASNYINVITL
jgi:hypothetical protein